MATKKFSPITPGLRFRVAVDLSELSKVAPEKSLLQPYTKTGGRGKDGRMSTRNVGGGHKRKYRIVDFLRNKHGVPATVKTLEYDPNRSAFIALVSYADGEKRYILAPEGLKVGDTVQSGENIAPNLGNTLLLRDIPLGTVIHNIEMQPGRGGVMARSAGTYAQVAAKDGKYVVIKLPSGETRMILHTCLATVGTVSNPDHGLKILGKAGRKRWEGRRPRVRGVAMNPVDHPMGGGEGRASGGHPRSRTGLYAKGQKTRNANKASSKLIIARKKNAKK
ncbi:MAG: 50S ribosomal protein L2 [Sphingobacteriales bacterium]|nr:50S ribosomal protein L2 [Sphingobacteriales bacterium]